MKKRKEKTRKKGGEGEGWRRKGKRGERKNSKGEIKG
jgi:hypothetical protein